MVPSRRAGTVFAVSAAFLLSVGLPASPVSAKDRVTKVNVTSAGCPRTLTVHAGPVTFEVTNRGASKVSEFEVWIGNQLLGEVESVASGMTRRFSLTLRAGTYTTECPGGTTQATAKLVVTGTSNVKDDAASESAVASYRGYLANESAQAVSFTQTFVAAIARGDVAAARAAYGPARAPYERLGPVIEKFGDLDQRIDAREGEVPAAEWGGFHRLEKALFADGTTAGMEPIGMQLLTDVQRLPGLVSDTTLDPATIANGAAELLDEVSTSTVTGAEERYSSLDLLDVRADLDGALAAYQALRPIVGSRKPSLATSIDRRFSAVDAALAPYQRGTGFALSRDLTPGETESLARAVDAVARPLSQVAGTVLAR